VDGKLTISRLRSDLARWWLLRSLPLRSVDLLKTELGLSWGFAVLLGWLALVLSGEGFLLCLVAAALLPFLAANSTLASTQDILNHSETRVLMSPSIAEENVPRQNIDGVIRALISVFIPLGMFSWYFVHPNQSIIGLAALPVALFILLFSADFCHPTAGSSGAWPVVQDLLQTT
jgi:hypothetical protein